MMLNYRAGDEWVVAVRDGVVLAVTGDRALEDATALWPALGAADATSVVLERLTSRGLTATPSFVLVSPAGTDALRVIARGAVDVDVAGTEGVVVTGRHAATWQERAVDGATGVRFGSAGATGPELPLLAGIVRAASASWSVHATDDRSATDSSVEDTVVVPRRTPAPPAAAEQELLADEQQVADQIVAEQVDLGEVADRRLADATVASEHVAEETIVAVDEGGTDEGGTDEGDADDSGSDEPADASVPAAGPADDTVVSGSIGPVSWIKDSVANSIELPPFISGSRPDASGPAAEPGGDPVGDHDGLTIMGGDVRRLLDARGEASAADHPAPAAAPAPSSVRILLPSGAREPIEQDVIVGRAPSVSKVSGSRIPRLVTVGSDDPDISRNHVQVSLEGDTVVVTDLNSRNGTVLAYPGKTPQKLRAGESTTVLVGTVIDLGGGITLQVVSD